MEVVGGVVALSQATVALGTFVAFLRKACRDAVLIAAEAERFARTLDDVRKQIRTTGGLVAAYRGQNAESAVLRDYTERGAFERWRRDVARAVAIGEEMVRWVLDVQSLALLEEFWRRVNWQRAARQREQIVLGVRAVAAQFAAVANLVLLEGQMREWRRPGLSARQLGAIEVKM
jgi:hypothetical protein